MTFDQGVWESYDGVFQNYMSIGVDAVAAYAFHKHREAHPELFTGPIKNMMWYVRKGVFASSGSRAPPPLHTYIELKIRRPQVG